MDYKDIDIEFVLSTAKKAGDAIMEIYKKDFAVETKDDKSPLTEADRAANAVIVQALTERYPEIPFISEETKQTAYADRKDWNLFWLIDPLDGTKEFIKRNGEFTVNIALIENGEPVLGVVHAPAQDKTYYGMKGSGAVKIAGGQSKQIENAKHYSEKRKVRVVGSRSHLSPETLEFVEQLKTGRKEVEFLSSGSSLKFCLVAEGEADVYPRFGPTMEWDTAAAQAVALCAGKQVLNWETKQPLRYNKENLLNPWFIVE